MEFSSYVENLLGNYPLEYVVLYIEKILIDKCILYDIIRDTDIIIKVRDENIDDIFKDIINSNTKLFSQENVLISNNSIHELETDTLIYFIYYAK